MKTFCVVLTSSTSYLRVKVNTGFREEGRNYVIESLYKYKRVYKLESDETEI